MVPIVLYHQREIKLVVYYHSNHTGFSRAVVSPPLTHLIHQLPRHASGPQICHILFASPSIDTQGLSSSQKCGSRTVELEASRQPLPGTGWLYDASPPFFVHSFVACERIHYVTFSSGPPRVQ